jgi:hypothetical protein
MTGKRRTRKQSREFFRALQSVVLTRFPNPDRTDCPGAAVLRTIATKTIFMGDPAIEHVGRCSPCFAELMELRRGLESRKVLWTTGMIAAAVVALTLLVGYFALPRLSTPAQGEAARPGPTDANSRAQSGEPTAGGQSASTTPAAQPTYETALLNLRDASATRSVEPPPTPIRPIEIRRGLLALTIELPIGSDAGPYEMEIRKPNQSPVRTVRGEARIVDGITRMVINIDTSSILPGEYEFGWRPGNFSWRHYPVLIR